ncbi:hypothetical protein DTL21_06270 [Bremerella cremea]|uniref:Uncharacterized protein n=1 Tax=Blastopirellula marina TaxID=124 RepID=A0A2S8FZD3_9BACT|nr:hypothetical protein C5Y83_06270 [Blastopirellula marina]RCS49933.1 hypothetical protein DTL21_06270 [Bremerella cremea]
MGKSYSKGPRSTLKTFCQQWFESGDGQKKLHDRFNGRWVRDKFDMLRSEHLSAQREIFQRLRILNMVNLICERTPSNANYLANV